MHKKCFQLAKANDHWLLLSPFKKKITSAVIKKKEIKKNQHQNQKMMLHHQVFVIVRCTVSIQVYKLWKLPIHRYILAQQT